MGMPIHSKDGTVLKNWKVSVLSKLSQLNRMHAALASQLADKLQLCLVSLIQGSACAVGSCFLYFSATWTYIGSG